MSSRRSPSINIKKYEPERLGTLRVIPMDETLYTTTQQKSFAFVNNKTGKVVQPKSYTNLLKLKLQIRQQGGQ